MFLNQDRLRFSAFFVALFGIGLLGGWMLKLATPMGMGLINDSTAYIAGARSILQGTGYSEIWLATGIEPIIHYPPLLSSILALIGLSGLDPLRGIRALNIALYGSNIWLMGILGWRMTGFKLAGLFLALSFALDAILLQLHAYAISEPLFIFLLLACILVLNLHIEKRSYALLVPTGIVTGLALLTRYVGLALLATSALVLLVLHRDWRRRITSLGIYLASALPWFFAWIIRNRQLTGIETNRGFGWHPPSSVTILFGINNFADWLFPVNSTATNTPLSIVTLGLIAIAITCWAGFVGFRYFLKPTISHQPNSFTFFSAVFTLVYASSLLASLSLFDATTRLLDRILSPVYVSFTVLMVSVFVWLWKHSKKTAQTTLGCLACLLLILAGRNYYQAIGKLMEDGQGYASARYQSSVVTKLVRELPAEVKLYTNSPPAIYSSTGRPSYIVFLDAELTSATKKFYAQINRSVKNGDAVLVFYGIRKDEINVEAYNFLTNGLTLSIKNGTQMVYDNSP